jgi:hypothetical protein
LEEASQDYSREVPVTAIGALAAAKDGERLRAERYAAEGWSLFAFEQSPFDPV